MNDNRDGRANNSIEPPFDSDYIRNRLRDLPPSAKLIAKVLAGNSWLSHQQIAEQSLLPEQTVRYGLKQLESAGILETSHCLRDPGKQLYALKRE